VKTFLTEAVIQQREHMISPTSTILPRQSQRLLQIGAVFLLYSLLEGSLSRTSAHRASDSRADLLGPSQ
jgi:hypothetical protein